MRVLPHDDLVIATGVGAPVPWQPVSGVYTLGRWLAAGPRNCFAEGRFGRDEGAFLARGRRGNSQ
jgi:hypothetical protein